MTENAAVTADAEEVFEKAMDGLVGVRYTPIALLGTQLVSGTNYCFLCEAAVVYPDAQPYYAIVSIYANLQGSAEIRRIVALNLGKIEETETVEDAQPQGTQLLGGWQIDRETALDVPDAVMHLATQTVAGSKHVILCKGWKLCYAAIDPQGEMQILKTIPLDLAALSQPAED